MTREEAEALISRSLDETLDPKEAEALQAYLETNAELAGLAESWKRIGDNLREEVSAAEVSVEEAWEDIQNRIHSENASNVQPTGSKVIAFPWMKPLLGAAALVMLGIFLGSLFPTPKAELSPAAEFTATTVEYVETDIAGASSIVYMGDETMWTVVWVDEPTDSSEI